MSSTAMSRFAPAAAALLLPFYAHAATGAADEAQEKVEVQEIVVTGSRIARRDYEADTPLTTVGQDILQSSGSFALESKLLEMPQFAGAASSQYSTGYFNSGAATLNLRNLGDNRNLVLLDGRRLQPSTTDLAIDINTIPVALIDSVEVITGGASAAYGADAVSGVVNFKLKKKFQGVQVDAYYGLSERGDNRAVDLSALMGGNFAEGRGNAVIALSYSDRGEVLNEDIPFLQNGFRVGALPGSASFLANGYYTPGTNQPSQAALNAYFGQFGAAPGSIPRGTSLGFNNNQTSVYNITGPAIYNYQNPLYPRYAVDTFTSPTSPTVKQTFTADTLASLPLKRYSVFGNATYDVNDGVTAYSQFMYTHYDSTTIGGAPLTASGWGAPVPYDAAHPVPAAFAALLDSRADPTAPWNSNKDLTYMGLGVVQHSNDVFQVLVGVNGKIPGSDVTWDLSASHGQTQLIDKGASGFASDDRYRELIAAPNYGANYTGEYGHCTSGVNPFGEQNGVGGGQFGDPTLPKVSADCIAYLNSNWTNETHLKQDIIELTAQGKLMTLPAGEARFAVGTDYRSDSVDFNPDRGFLPNSLYEADIAGQFGTLPVGGSNSTKEFYVEGLFPLLHDLPLVKLLEINPAYRYSDYDHSGGTNTYKVDLNWQVLSPLRVRGGYSRAVRAPNVVEQYGPPTLVFDSAVDACQSISTASYANNAANPNRSQVQKLCRQLMGAGAPPVTDPVNDPNGLNTYLGSASGALNSYPSGNPNLKPEKADTYTVGVVFAPTWELPANLRFTASADYYNIDIKGAIGYVNANLTYQLCFNADGKSNPTYDVNNVYCKTIGRQQVTGGLPSGVFSTYLNQGAIATSGLDLQGDMHANAGPGVVGLNVIANHLDSFKRTVGPGAPAIEYAGFTGGYYKWKTYTNLSYQVGPALAGLRWRYLSSAEAQDYLVSPCTSTRCFADTPSYNLFDFYSTWQVNGTLQVRGGIDNLMNRQPPVVRGIPGNTDPQNYDIIGRQFYLAVSAKL